MDRFDLYECCVQSPRHVVNFLRAAHSGEPLVLREDFCGSGAVSRRWAAEAIKRGDDARALAVDMDAEVIDKARELAREIEPRRIEFVQGDCVHGSVPYADRGTDVIFVGNFSIGYLQTREVLIEYLRACRNRLEAGNCGFGGGIFVCDIYGGAGAFKLGAIQRRHTGPKGEVVHYLWRHESADPMTGMVENSISFRVEKDGEIVDEIPDAFRYLWRLWGLAELREAMLDAGFGETSVHSEVNLAPGEPAHAVTDPAKLGEDWSVLVVAR